MDTKFRIAVIGYVLLSLAIEIMTLFIGPREMPEPAIEYINWWSSQPLSMLESIAAWLSLSAALLSLVSAVGMFFFAAWSRHLFTVTLIALVVSEGLIGLPIIKGGFEYQMDSIAGIIAGSIVAMAYLSPISEKFRAKTP